MGKHGTGEDLGAERFYPASRIIGYLDGIGAFEPGGMRYYHNSHAFLTKRLGKHDAGLAGGRCDNDMGIAVLLHSPPGYLKARGGVFPAGFFEICHLPFHTDNNTTDSPLGIPAGQTGIIVRMLAVGLTGNYGMGKSTVLPIFRELGAVTLEADEIVRELLTEKHVLAKIRELMGRDVFYRNGRLNRKKVAKTVFQDDSMRRSLEDILHPLVFDIIETFLGRMSGRRRIAVIEVPLLFERGYQGKFDRTVTVYSRVEQALSRLAKAGVTRQEALQRLRAQLPVEEKIRLSDFAIDNSGTLQETARQAEKIFHRLVREDADGRHHRP